MPLSIPGAGADQRVELRIPVELNSLRLEGNDGSGNGCWVGELGLGVLLERFPRHSAANFSQQAPVPPGRLRPAEEIDFSSRRVGKGSCGIRYTDAMTVELKRRRNYRLLIVAAFLVGTGGLFLIWTALGYLSYFSSSRGVRIDFDQAAVVHQIQSLSRLQSVVYRMDKVVEAERASRWFPTILSGDRILMIIHGEVTAGVDLAGLTSDSVTVSGNSARIRLPSPTVFSSRIDNQRTRVYSRDTGLLTPFDPHLESEVRRAAEAELAKAALEDGILQIARRNAEDSLRVLLGGLGLERIEFD